MKTIRGLLPLLIALISMTPAVAADDDEKPVLEFKRLDLLDHARCATSSFAPTTHAPTSCSSSPPARR